ncbi:MAG: hypothetical protein WC657_06970 [Candidatus Paceibacterota bacterium]|jgi:hypothetical protein
MYPIRERTKTDESADLLLYSLSPEEQAFILALMDGKTQTDAYLEVSPTCSRDGARTMGSKWMMRENIRAARDELLDMQCAEALRILRTAAGEAAKKLITSMRNGDDGDRAARDILDRIGVMGGARLEITQGRQQDLRGFIEADDTSE